MGILDRIFGSDKAPTREQATQQRGQPTDDQAIARYRYLLETAPPETIEQAHAEAFARLTPEQRRMALQQLSASMPEAERAAVAPGGADPQALARLATRAEVRQPGTMEQTFRPYGRRRRIRWTDGGQLFEHHRRYGHRKHDCAAIF